MPSNLAVALFGGGTFFEVQTTQDGILTKALFDLQLRLLQFAFLLQPVLLFLLLSLQLGIVCEEVQLLNRVLLWLGGDFRCDMIGGEAQTSNQQDGVHTAVEDAGGPFHDEAR